MFYYKFVYIKLYRPRLNFIYIMLIPFKQVRSKSLQAIRSDLVEYSTGYSSGSAK